jgi:hypothetical protein
MNNFITKQERMQLGRLKSSELELPEVNREKSAKHGRTSSENSFTPWLKDTRNIVKR